MDESEASTVDIATISEAAAPSTDTVIQVGSPVAAAAAMTMASGAAELALSDHHEVQPPSGPQLELKTRRAQFKTQASNIATRRSQAVCVRNAYKTYGPKSNPNVILENLNMTVPKGTIYGLLGASGCGKTTLLSCIVGRRRLNDGEIWVLGGRPGSKGSGVPGPRVGYMPQEIALYGEFSIRETFIFFGWCAGMATSAIEEKIEFLIKFLQLPAETRFVKNLSGGQQRRVSLAASLLAEPELLILDEPTVGVDPVLRQNIWDHLVHITKDGRTTIIITTHYIEETRQAGIIGLMRSGKFLAEESPRRLMEMHRLDTLEDVFLKLSRKQNMGLRRRSSILSSVTGLPVDLDAEDEMSGEFGDNISISSRRKSGQNAESKDPFALPPEENGSTQSRWILNPKHMKALIWKNFMWMWRNYGMMLFIIGLPVVQIILFCLSIGKNPTGLGVAIVNHELNSSSQSCQASLGCYDLYHSCRFFNHLQQGNLEYTFYDTEAEARHAVEKGWAWSYVVVPANYSKALIERIELGRDADNATVLMADLDIYMDMSNQQIGQLLIRHFYDAFLKFVREVMTSCGWNPNASNLPIKFEQPVYGPLEPVFTDFAAPGVILTIIFFLSVALTSGAMLLERNEGLLERSLVIGVTGTEILFGQVVTQFIIMAGQAVMVLLVAIGVFKITCEGSVFAVLGLTILTGLCGMCFGFVVACSCENERSATYMAMGSFLPIVMLCGIIWPIEGMHSVLQYISYLLPLTKSTESFRAMLARGWEIDNPTVYEGFIATTVWIFVFLTIAILLLKFKKG